MSTVLYPLLMRFALRQNNRMTETLLERIDKRLKDLNISAAKASVLAGGSRDLIRGMKRKPGQMPQGRMLAGLARALETNEQWLMTGEGTDDAPKPRVEPSEVSDPGQPIQMPIVRDLPRDLPVYGTASGAMLGNKEGAMQLTGDTIEYVRRPPALMSVEHAYALYVENDSMVPAFDPGDLIYVHPRMPAPGDYTIVQVQTGEMEGIQAFIKRYKGKNSRFYICEQYNPVATVEYPIQTTRSLHRVVKNPADGVLRMKIARATTLFAATIALTGCFNLDQTYDFSADGTVQTDVVLTVAAELDRHDPTIAECAPTDPESNFAARRYTRGSDIVCELTATLEFDEFRRFVGTMDGNPIFGSLMPTAAGAWRLTFIAYPEEPATPTNQPTLSLDQEDLVATLLADSALTWTVKAPRIVSADGYINADATSAELSIPLSQLTGHDLPGQTRSVVFAFR
jgi:phage repressor protein C with HTH and peptisase S24 domain